MADRHGPDVCRFYARTGQCRFGARCNFRHERGGVVQANGRPQATQARGATAGMPSASGRPVGIPWGACNLFWTTGNCARSFDCSFQHVRGPGAAAGIPSTAQEAEYDAAETDFFSMEGLAVISNASRNTRYSMNPVEAHNNLQPFLRDNYHFDGASRVQGFVRIIGSINDRNKTWVCIVIQCPSSKY